MQLTKLHCKQDSWRRLRKSCTFCITSSAFMRQHSFVPIYAQQHPCWPVPPACPPACLLVPPARCYLQTPLKCLPLPPPGHWKWCQTGWVPEVPCCHWHQTGDSPTTTSSPCTTQPGFYLSSSAHLGHNTLTCMLAPWLSQPCKNNSEQAGQLSQCLFWRSHPIWWNCRGPTLSDNPWLNPYPEMCLGEFISDQ